ncbi:MAG: ornithine cyclodeaminase family protein [Acidobacteria bacterium]|nr:ornithine cyclodeaminase family protein [Acidobacteriota bacterium]
MLYLTEQDVTNLLTMQDALDAVETAFKAQATGDATNEPRRRVRANNAILMTMSGAIASLNAFGLKAYSVARGKARFHVNLYDTATGELLALIEADKLGQMRTGAASGIATKYLAQAEAKTVGIYGTGWQAQSQLAAVCAVRNIQSVKVYSRSEEKRNHFSATMSKELGIEDISPVAAPEEAAEADIIITITSSREPVLKGAWIKAGTHINAAGGNSILRSETDDEVIRRANFIAVDSKDQARMEAGEFVFPIEKGLLTWERVQEVCHVVAGNVAGRKNANDITFFKSLGLAIEDVATAALLYRKAQEQNVGRAL